MSTSSSLSTHWNPLSSGSDIFCRTSPFGMHRYVPFEILVNVLTDLDWRTLVRCQAVCRFWYQAIRETLALQYKISLGLNGLVDGPINLRLSLSERMRLVEERRRAWRTLDFKRYVRIPTPGECHAYELVGGVFAKAMNPSPGPQNDVFGPGGTPMPMQNPGSKHFCLLNLPGTSAQDKFTGEDVDRNKMIVREDVGVLCRDFGIDPTQDLIALVEQPDAAKPSIVIHLRTISTNRKHPSASVPTLSQSMRSSFEGAEIQICDDIIAILVRVRTVPRLVIWQWTSGKLLVSEVDSRSCRSLDDFSLLSSYAFMVTCRFTQGSIKVYTFRIPSGRFLLPSPSTPAKLTDLRCSTLLLPQLQPNNHYAELTTHTAPFTSGVTDGQPFGVSEEVRVHVMSVLTQPAQAPHSSSDSEIGTNAGFGIMAGGHAAGFVVVLSNKGLLKYAEKNLERSEKTEVELDKGKDRDKDAKKGGKKNAKDIEVPWDEWGPRNTRWFQERSQHAWQRYVHGSRVVRCLMNAWPSTQCRMQVQDFNVHPSHPTYESDHVDEHIDNVEPDVPYFHRLVAGPSLVRDRTVFRGGGVESRLPYREVTLKKEVGPYSGFMVDEERVIGLAPMTFANGDMKQIDVFTF